MWIFVVLVVLSGMTPAQALGDERPGQPARAQEPAAVVRQLDHLRELTNDLRRTRPDLFGSEAGLGPRSAWVAQLDAEESLEHALARELLLLERTVARIQRAPDPQAGVLALTRELDALEERYTLELPSDGEIVNVGLLVENFARRPLLAPTLTLAGQPAWSDLASITCAAVGDAEGPEATALALWRFVIESRAHGAAAHTGSELHDPVKLLNVYGYGLCDDSANALVALARQAGLPARVWALGGHIVAELFYDDAWHVFDADHEVHYRDAAGRVLGLEELVTRQDLADLAVRVPGRPVRAIDFERLAAMFASTADNRIADYPAPQRAHDMRFELRGGERVMFWYGEGSRRVATTRFSELAQVANGEWIHELSLGAAQSSLAYRLPWPILGGRIEWLDTGVLDVEPPRIELRTADDTWRLLPDAQLHDGRWSINLDSVFAGSGAEPHYALDLRVSRTANDTPVSMQVALVFQHAARALPTLASGRNDLHWTSRGGAARVTHLYRSR